MSMNPALRRTYSCLLATTVLASQSVRTSSSIASTRINGSALKLRCSLHKLCPASAMLGFTKRAYTRDSQSLIRLLSCVGLRRYVFERPLGTICSIAPFEAFPPCHLSMRSDCSVGEAGCSGPKNVRLGCTPWVYPGAGQKRRAGVRMFVCVYVYLCACLCASVCVCLCLSMSLSA